MWDIKSIKARGRTAFKSNYWPSVAVAFLMALLTSASGAASGRSTSPSDTQQVGDTLSTMPQDEQMMVAAIVVGALAVIAAIAFALRIFVFNHVEVGGCRFFRKNAENPGTSFGIVKEGFQDYGHVLVTMLLRDVFIGLWTLLLIIPGIIKAYSYRMVPYIVKEYPELSPREVISLSNEMMRGNKWQAFVLDLSFIGWILLGVITLGLGNVFWTNPYMQSTNAQLFLELNRKNR